LTANINSPNSRLRVTARERDRRAIELGMEGPTLSADRQRARRDQAGGAPSVNRARWRVRRPMISSRRSPRPR